MVKTAVGYPGDPDDDARKDLLAERGDADVRLSQVSAERARVCIEAAQLRAKHWTYAKIADRLGLVSPAVAYRAVQTGLTLIPSEDVREVRRLSDQRRAKIGRELLRIIADPGPLVSQGKVMRAVVDVDENGREIYGDSFPDNMVRTRALEALLKLDAEDRKAHGADAPKRTLALTADMITSRITELKKELGLGGAAGMLEGLAEQFGITPPEDPGKV